MGVIMRYGNGLLGVTFNCTLLAPMLLHLVEITHTYMHTYIHIHLYVHTYMRTYIRAYVHTYVLHTYIHTMSYVHTHIQTSTHPPTHPSTYVYTYLLSTKYHILCLQRQVQCHAQQQGTPDRQVPTLATCKGGQLSYHCTAPHRNNTTSLHGQQMDLVYPLATHTCVAKA